jgi:hypothetical protein
LFGDNEPYAAQTTGDEIHTSAHQSTLFGGGVKVETLKRLNKPLAVAKRDSGILGGGSHLGDNLGCAFIDLISFEIDIKAATGDSREFFGDNPR